MDISTALEIYKRWWINEGFSPDTIAIYALFLNHISQRLDNKEIEKITAADLDGFMLYLRTDYKPHRKGDSTEPLGGCALDNYWKCIRSFFRFCVNVLHLRTEKNRPDKALARPKFDTAEIQPFTKDDMFKIMDGCEWSKEFKRSNTKPYRLHRTTWIRDKMAAMILLDTGIRVGELCRLKIKEVDTNNGEIFISPFHRGAKTKSRSIPIGPETQYIIMVYLSKLKDYSEEEKLIGVAPTNIRKLLKGVQLRTGVKDVHPHRFRHTFAIEFLRNGGNIFDLKYILGHSSWSMVKRYLALSKADIHNAHKIASPVKNWGIRSTEKRRMSA
jgi:integrase/recombinase XerD